MAKSDLLKKKTKVKKPAGAPPSIINNKIEIRPYHRTEQDIPKWRQAIQSAESQIPRRNLLYNLYADVDLDGHVEAVTGKRRDPIKAANWQFVDKKGVPVDEINDVIDTIGFDDLLDEIINSRFWGYSILEPKFWKDASEKWQMDAGLIPRLNYRPENGIVAFDTTGEDGINIREGIYAKTIMEVGKVKDLGLYMKAAPYAVLKRGGLGDYAAFIQTFGNPLIDAMWNGFDEKQRLQLNQALNEMGASGVIIRPDGTTIDIKENNVNATGDAHGNFLRFLNAEISKALLGSTETTESSKSSGYAQAETHQDQDDLKHMNDLTYTRKVLNSRFIRILQTYGFDTKGGEFKIEGEEQELTKKESFEIHKGIVKEMGVPVDDDFWYDTYGMPKPKNYEQMKKAKKENQDSENTPPSKGGNDKKPKPTEEPSKKDPDDEEAEEVKLTEQSWWIKLYRRFFVEAPVKEAGADLTCGHHHTIKLADDTRFDDDALIQRVWDSKGKLTFDDALFFHTADVLTKGFKEGWDKEDTVKLSESPGFIYGFDDPTLLAAFEQNLFRFTGAKTLAEVQQLNQLFQQATSFEDFYQQAKKQTEVFNVNWLETEYNTAVLTGEASATYNRLIKQAELFPYWEYKTAGDDHVRHTHRLLEGLILPANDPRWKKIFPPNGWNCRCYIVPRMKHEFDESQLKAMRQRADNYIQSTQFSKEEAQGWGVNRAEAGEVFTANQQYVNKFPGKAAKLLNNLKAADWNLKSYSQAKKAATAEAKVYEGTASEFYEQLEELENNRILRDYNKRPLIVEKKNYDRHTSDGKKRRAHRVQLLNVLEQSLISPDEVWINQEKLDNINYIKYYQDEAYLVNGTIKNGALNVITWFKLEEKKVVIDNYRRGLLVYRK